MIFLQILVLASVAIASSGYAPLTYYPQHIPVIGPNGVPIEPADVQHARAAHLAAHAQANNLHYAAPIAPLAQYHGLALNGLPLDTPEVAHAKAQHFRDYAVAAQRNGVHVPIAHYSGLPVDTPEVQHAKAAHFAAHAAARGLHYRKRRGIYG